MSRPKDPIGLVVPLAALSIPIVAILSPVLSQLIPLTYILATIGGVVLAGRHLLGYQHQLELEKLEKRLQLEAASRERLAEAERLIALDDPVEQAVQRIEARQRARAEAGEERDSDPAS